MWKKNCIGYSWTHEKEGCGLLLNLWKGECSGLLLNPRKRGVTFELRKGVLKFGFHHYEDWNNGFEIPDAIKEWTYVKEDRIAINTNVRSLYPLHFLYL